MEYTIEQFEIDYDNSSEDKREDILNKAIDNLDLSDPYVKDILLKYREDFSKHLIYLTHIMDQTRYC